MLSGNDNILFELFTCILKFKKNMSAITPSFLNILEITKNQDNFQINFDENLFYLFNKLYLTYLSSKNDNQFKDFYFLRGENYKLLTNNKHYFSIFVILLAIAMLSSDTDIFKTYCDDLLFFYNSLTNNLCKSSCGKDLNNC
jgi:hypothetical protein